MHRAKDYTFKTKVYLESKLTDPRPGFPDVKKPFGSLSDRLCRYLVTALKSTDSFCPVWSASKEDLELGQCNGMIQVESMDYDDDVFEVEGARLPKLPSSSPVRLHHAGAISLEVTLRGGKPWGFGLSGGLSRHSPVAVVKVGPHIYTHLYAAYTF